MKHDFVSVVIAVFLSFILLLLLMTIAGFIVIIIIVGSTDITKLQSIADDMIMILVTVFNDKQ